jgi:hypothetical protein
MTPSPEHGSGAFLEIFSGDMGISLRQLMGIQSLYLPAPRP